MFLSASLGGSSNSQFEPANKNSNSRGFLQSAEPYGSKSQFENGRRAPAFEPLTGNGDFKSKNEKTNIANGQMGDHKVKSKEKTGTIQKYSNHIEFIDYIPAHEVITYRHLFAYGFYVG